MRWWGDYMSYILLGIGFILLIKGRIYLYRNFYDCKKYFMFQVSVIGLTIVAFGKVPQNYYYIQPRLVEIMILRLLMLLVQIF